MEITGTILFILMLTSPIIIFILIWRKMKAGLLIKFVTAILLTVITVACLYPLSTYLLMDGAFGATVGSTFVSTDKEKDSVVKINMTLSAFGVESDKFPNVNATIDLVADTGFCTRTYYNSTFKDQRYQLSREDLKKIKEIIPIEKLSDFKQHYKSLRSDQPTSITKISTTLNVYTFEDYGLIGEGFLQKLYSIVYKLDQQ